MWLSFFPPSSCSKLLPDFRFVQKSAFPCCCSDRAWSARSTVGSQKNLGAKRRSKRSKRRKRSTMKKGAKGVIGEKRSKRSRKLKKK